MRLNAVAMGLSAVFAGNPAAACVESFATDPSDVRYAKLVVVGRVTNYEIVHAQARERRGYARFEIEVDKVLKGQVSGPLIVTWYNSTFGVPEQLGLQPVLIALKPGSPWAALRGPSATVLRSHEPEEWTVLQAPCSRAFIFEMASRQADAVLNAMGTPTKP